MPVIDSNKEFKEAVKVMSQKKLGIIVITKNKFIRGLMTDGDIRRSIENRSKEKNIKKFTKNFPLFINENMPASKALAIMNDKKITSLLVVSDKDYKKENKLLKGIIHIHFILKNGI